MENSNKRPCPNGAGGGGGGERQSPKPSTSRLGKSPSPPVEEATRRKSARSNSQTPSTFSDHQSLALDLARSSSTSTTTSSSSSTAIAIPGTSSTKSVSITGSSTSGHSSGSSRGGGASTVALASTSATTASTSKQSSKRNRHHHHHHQQSSNRFNSPTSHGRCLYFPGAYSSFGQLSHLQRKQCCHCQIPYVSCAPAAAAVAAMAAAAAAVAVSSSTATVNSTTTNRLSSNHDSATGNRSSSNLASNISRNSHSGNQFSSYGFHRAEDVFAIDLSVGTTASATTSTTGLTTKKFYRNPESLLEIAARLVAQHIPYEYIEQRYTCIPEPVQRRIIFWSFPRDESYIRLYSSISSIFKHTSLMSTGSIGSGGGGSAAAAAAAVSTAFQLHNGIVVSSNYSRSISPPNGSAAGASSTTSSSLTEHGSHLQSNSSNTSSLFNNGLLLMWSGAVHQVIQVGFNLSGVVTNVSPFNTSGVFESSLMQNVIYPANTTTAASASSNSDLARSSAASTSGANSGLLPLVNVDSIYSRKNSNSYQVSITFDRCKITSVTCTCNLKDYHLFWCEHVVALALYRIQKPNAFELRVPVSETLLQFDRDQLQKLVQYLIAEHHVQILPTVQRLADELSQKRSTINLIAGAPDPTAGACVYGPHDWYLNEEKIGSQVRDLVKYVSIPESKQIILLFYKVIEMLKIKDSNGPRFLRIITEQFLYSYSHYLKPDDSFERFDPFIFLWDHLTNLWIFIVADPSMAPLKRIEWREMFRHWSHLANCPREDSYFSLEVDTGNESRSNFYNKIEDDNENVVDYYSRRLRLNSHYSSSTSGNSTSRPRRRRILERALDATYLTWDDTHLQLILRHDGKVDRSSFLYFSEYLDRDGFPMWSEHLPTACVRIASLRVNGRNQEALRLAMAVVRYLRHCQHNQKHQRKQLKLFAELDVAPASDSWIGSPVDPIGILFDTLAEASLTLDSKPLDSYYALAGYDKKVDLGIFSKNVLVDVFVMYNEVNALLDRNSNTLTAEASGEYFDKPKYRHVSVPGAKYEWDTYLTAAMYAALIGLSQNRRSPDLESQRDKTYRQEERLIRKLLDIKLDRILIDVLRQQARFLLEIGLLSDYVTLDSPTKNVPLDIAQIPGLARYMFGALLPTDQNLAYEIGLRSLRFFSFKEESRSNDTAHLPTRSNLCLYLDVQLILAKTMLFAARNDSKRLEIIFQTIQRYVKSPQYLNKLAQDVFSFSLSGNRHEHLLRVAYAFGLHLSNITLNDSVTDNCRKSTIQWLVTCASEIGCDSVLHLLNCWRDYFTPLEAVRLVATTVLSPNFNRLCGHSMQQDEIYIAARKLAVECAYEDPSNCALISLSLCEKDKTAFDTITKMVEKAGSVGRMNSLKLFTIARYLEHQNVSDHACKIALLAASQVTIPLTADTHQSIGDLQWACSLAQSLGTNELSELVNILIQNVRCAPVLADMIRRCTFPPQPVASKHVMLHQIQRSNLAISDPSLIDHMMNEERRRRHFKAYPLDRPPLSNLLYAAVKAYIETVMKRLEHISPRHYSDFIEFLNRAQETIILAPDGKNEFSKLLEKIKTLYKGKKKLMHLVKERFG